MSEVQVPEGYRTQAEDTSVSAERFLVAAWSRMQPWEKFQLLRDLNATAEGMARAGVLLRHPQASEREIALRLASLRLDRTSMVNAFGWDPALKGY